MKKRYSTFIPAILLLAGLLVLSCCGPGAETGNGQISGRVYFDENADEECQTCECGIPEASVTLYIGACGGDMVQMIKTDADGYFQFSNVAPGSYCVFSGLTTSCEGYLPTTSLSQSVTVGAGDQIDLDWFGYDMYIDSLRADN